MFKNFILFKKYILPYWQLELGLIFLLLGANALSLSSPYILKLLIDNALPKMDPGYLKTLLYLLLASYVLRFFISWASDLLYTRVSNLIINSMRKDLFAAILRKKLSFFFRNKSAELVFYINGEVEKIEDTMTYTLLRFVNSLFSILGLSTMLLVLNARLFLISAMVFPVILFVTKYYNPKIKNSYSEERKQEADMEDFFMERFSNIRLIKSFNAQDYQQNKLAQRVAALFSVKMRSAALASLHRNFTSFLVALGPLFVFGLGGSDVLHKVMTLGSLIAFIQYLLRLYSPSTDLVYLYNDIVKSASSVSKIVGYFDDSEDETVKGLTFEVMGDEPIVSIEFQDVTFGFEDNNTVLKNLHLILQRGNSYAVVGRSGSGKSTIAHLLCGFYDQSGGCILVNGRYDLKLIERFAWRKKILLISQGNNLINETIRENILLGMEGVSKPELEQAIDFARLEDVLSAHDKGLDTYVGANGANLSGGQQQRVAIARMFLRRPDLIIVDEATSGIDTITEEQIFRKLKELYSDAIILVISHRLSSVKEFTTIYHLEEGRVRESGDHQELLAQKGRYYELFRNQL